jgi:Rnl2 family RNA ligase
MAEFVKYDHIENHYNFKRNLWEDHDLESETFVIQEKIDGSNVSFIFTEHGFCKLASRNQYLGQLGNVTFYGIEAVIPSIQDFIDHFTNVAKTERTEYQFYAEIFGVGIQNRVNYGPKAIKFFDLRINGQMVSQAHFYQVMEPFSHLIVPTLAKVQGITAALEYSNEFQSTLVETDVPNIAEGIVIKPWNKVMYNRHSEKLIIKSKNDKFSEKTKSKKVFKDKEPLPQGLIEARDKFAEYVNENRVMSVFSKIGPISSIKEIGKYIPLVLEDAATDYLAEEGLESLGKDERKVLFTSVTPMIVNILKQKLSES